MIRDGAAALLALLFLATHAGAEDFSKLAKDYPGREVPVGFVCDSMAAAVKGAKAMEDPEGDAVAVELELLRSGLCRHYPDGVDAAVREVRILRSTAKFDIWQVDDAGVGRLIIQSRAPGA